MLAHAHTRSAASALERPSLADQLADQLRQQVEGGRLRVGDRLPTEAQLCATHGVSRSVVREAVHRLKSHGLVTSRQGSGVYVNAPPVHRPLEFDPRVLESVQAVVQVVEVRRVLEGEIAALAADRATRAQVSGLRRALAAVDVATDEGRDGVAEDLAFHRLIGESTGNPQFGRLIGFLEQYLREAMRITRGNEARHQAFMDAVRAEHRAIVDAIAAHDARAARRAALTHLEHSQQRLGQGGIIPTRRATLARARKKDSMA
jgi:GntR family transcriptional repressor for pyruvate dehydrogenase complex